MDAQFYYQTLTPKTWPDFVQLFAEHGPQNGCWCMYWRVKRADFHRHFGDDHQRALRQIVESGRPPGILAYLDGQPVGWCSVAPREEFAALERSPTLKRVDDQPVWSIVCFFIAKAYQGRGLSSLLIQAGVQYAAENGAKIVEAYPLCAEIAQTQPYERYMGIESSFARAGFKVAVRRSERRALMRYIIEDNETT